MSKSTPVRFFEGTVVGHGRQPGIYIPRELEDVFKPRTETEAATLAHVRLCTDPSERFRKWVAHANSSQSIILVPKERQNVFVTGAKCLVTLTDDDELTCRSSEDD
jgi:hypothetical protein